MQQRHCFHWPHPDSQWHFMSEYLDENEFYSGFHIPVSIVCESIYIMVVF